MSDSSSASNVQSWFGFSLKAGRAVQDYLPGLFLVMVITAASFGLRAIPGLAQLSPMIIGIIIGVVMCNLAPLPEAFKPGVSLAGKGLLRFAVALLGSQITFSQIADIGAWGIASAAISLLTTFFFSLWLGRLLGIGRSLTILIAAGTSVCGAAAIAGANSAAGGSDEDVTYAVASITLLGTIAMFGYPLIGNILQLPPETFGAWIGLSVHEVAQVVGAGFQHGNVAGQNAVIVKLVRVLMLAFLVTGLSAYFRSHPRSGTQGEKASSRPTLVPLFIIGFLTICAMNTWNFIPELPRRAMITGTPILLTAALAALGLGTRFDKLKQLGLKPLAVCAAASIVIALLSYILVKI